MGYDRIAVMDLVLVPRSIQGSYFTRMRPAPSGAPFPLGSDRCPCLRYRTPIKQVLLNMDAGLRPVTIKGYAAHLDNEQLNLPRSMPGSYPHKKRCAATEHNLARRVTIYFREPQDDSVKQRSTGARHYTTATT